MLIRQDKQEVAIHWRPWEEDTYIAEGVIYEESGSCYCSEVSRGLDVLHPYSEKESTAPDGSLWPLLKIAHSTLGNTVPAHIPDDTEDCQLSVGL